MSTGAGSGLAVVSGGLEGEGSAGVVNTPTGLSANGFSTTEILVDWDFTPNANGYNLYISATEFGVYVLTAGGVASLTKLVVGLTVDTDYWFKVSALNSALQESALSSAVMGSTNSISGVEQRAWAQFKDQLQGYAALAAYVKTWKFDRTEQIMDQGLFPFLHVFVDAITGENYQAMPKRKTTFLNVQVHGKIHGAKSVLDSEVLKFDELIKNAIESDLQLSGECNIQIVGDSRIEAIADQIVQTVITLQIETIRFTAGNR